MREFGSIPVSPQHLRHIDVDVSFTNFLLEVTIRGVPLILGKKPSDVIFLNFANGIFLARSQHDEGISESRFLSTGKRNILLTSIENGRPDGFEGHLHAGRPGRFGLVKIVIHEIVSPRFLIHLGLFTRLRACFWPQTSEVAEENPIYHIDSGNSQGKVRCHFDLSSADNESFGSFKGC